MKKKLFVICGPLAHSSSARRRRCGQKQNSDLRVNDQNICYYSYLLIYLASIRSRRHHWQGPSCLKKLYQLLLGPLEDDLPEGYPSELMLVLDADLYLVPFAMLKAPTAQVRHPNS